MKKLTLLFLSIGILISCSVVIGQEDAKKAELPVLVTSCGQSPCPAKFKVFMKRLKFDYVYDLQADADVLVSKKEAGTPFKSIIIVTGASLKGMGAAGVSIDDELARANRLIEEAKKQNIKIIGSHIGGKDRRAIGADQGDNTDEQSIDTVCPNSALMIIRKEGDYDERFTRISKAKNIPMVVFEKYNEIPKVLKELFTK